MATNKHASIRYNALDKCFANTGKKYYMEDLIEACEEALLNYTGNIITVQKRQIYDDISFMESPEGFNIELNRIVDNRRKYYRYADSNFSIKKKLLSDKEQKQLRAALLTLSKLKGMPQFEWMEDTIIRLNSELDLTGQTGNIVHFDQNTFLTGIEHLAPLYEAILNKTALEVEYFSFKSNTVRKFILHPYILKQYNNRWFCFGLNHELEKISNLALDRIKSIKATKKAYIENETIDFNEYFEDSIGVTVLEEKPVEITLDVANDLMPYIKTKPLHGSMKMGKTAKKTTPVKLKLIPNYEFESLILSFGEKIQILEPIELRKKIQERIKCMTGLYKK